MPGRMQRGLLAALVEGAELMAAYMMSKITPVCRGLSCNKQATWNVYNTRNEFVGEYCERHAAALVKTLSKEKTDG